MLPSSSRTHRKSTLRFVGAAGLFFALLAGCVPSASPMNDTALRRCLDYQGRIETMAIVLDWGSVNEQLQDQVYADAVDQVYEHPCTRVRFDVIERNSIQVLLQEQDLIRDAYVDNRDGPRLGRLLGANYVLFVRLDSVSLQQVDTGSIVNDLLGVPVRAKAWISDVRVSLRLVDTETGLVVTRARGSATSALPSFVNVDGTSGGLDTRRFALDAAFGPAIQDAVNILLVRL